MTDQVLCSRQGSPRAPFSSIPAQWLLQCLGEIGLHPPSSSTLFRCLAECLEALCSASYLAARENYI